MNNRSLSFQEITVNEDSMQKRWTSLALSQKALSQNTKEENEHSVAALGNGSHVW